MPDPAGRSTPLLMRDLMFAALRVKDDRLNALAFELFARSGARSVRRLVLEAADRRNPTGFRLRALGAIARVGAVTEPLRFHGPGGHRRPGPEPRDSRGGVRAHDPVADLRPSAGRGRSPQADAARDVRPRRWRHR